MGSRARDPPVGRHATTLAVLVAFLTLAVGGPVGSTAADRWPSDEAQKVGETWAPSGANIVRLRGTLEATDEPPLPPEGTEHVVLTSESNLGNPDALLSLVLSFRKHHDDSTGKVVLLSTASRAKDRTKWSSWAETHGIVVGFVKPPHRQIVIGRFFAYHDYVKRLLTHRPTVVAVAMMDATDVLFQSELMSSIPLDSVAYVLEPKHMTIGACPVHKRWIEGCKKYGHKVWQRVKDKGRVCAGTVLGGTSAVEKFLEGFTAEMTRTDFCNDQGVLNVMVHTGALGESPLLWTHEDGPVLSLNTAKEKDDVERVKTAPALHFGHSSAWASRYLGREGGKLAKEWREGGTERREGGPARTPARTSWSSRRPPRRYRRTRLRRVIFPSLFTCRPSPGTRRLRWTRSNPSVGTTPPRPCCSSVRPGTTTRCCAGTTCASRRFGNPGRSARRASTRWARGCEKPKPFRRGADVPRLSPRRPWIDPRAARVPR